MAKLLNIEIGTSQVRVAVTVPSGKVRKVIQAFSFPISKGSVDDGNIRDTQGIGENLKKELTARNLSSVKKAVFTVFSSRIATREATVPVVKEKLLPGMIQANAMDYFPIDITKYVLTYQILGTEDKDLKKQYRLMVYASPRPISTSYLEMARFAGLTIERLDFLGNSMYQAAKQDADQGVHMNIKVEEKATLLTVIKDGKLSLQRNVNYGIDVAVEAVRAFPEFGTELSYEDGWDIIRTRKCIRGSLNYEPDFLEPEDTDEGTLLARQEVTEALRYLCGNVSRIMDYYISRHPDDSFASISLAGQGAECLGLENLLSDELGQEVELARCPRSCGLKDAMLPAGETEACYVGAVGSIYNPVNLLEISERKLQLKKQEESLKGALVILGTAVFASLILAGTGIGVHTYQYVRGKSLNSKIEDLQPMQELYDSYTLAKQQHADFLDMYGETQTPNENLQELIEEMEQKMPSSMNISNLQSSGQTLDMTMNVGSKAEAAKVLLQLRTFESLTNVTSSGFTVGEDSTVTFSVRADYLNAAVDSQKEQ